MKIIVITLNYPDAHRSQDMPFLLESYTLMFIV
jgi:hypothetical protein